MKNTTNAIIRNDVIHQIFFAFRNGNGWPKTDSGYESKLNHLLYLFSNITGKKADIQINFLGEVNFGALSHFKIWLQKVCTINKLRNK
jgi:hypothetical protein